MGYYVVYILVFVLVLRQILAPYLNATSSWCVHNDAHGFEGKSGSVRQMSMEGSQSPLPTWWIHNNTQREERRVKKKGKSNHKVREMMETQMIPSRQTGNHPPAVPLPRRSSLGSLSVYLGDTGTFVWASKNPIYSFNLLILPCHRIPAGGIWRLRHVWAGEIVLELISIQARSKKLPERASTCTERDTHTLLLI